MGLYHPLVYVNVVFMLNVCILFWLISLVQKSTWLIDPYWTFIPPMIAIYYAFHPLARGDATRSNVTLGLVCAWATRLTHSYFRREKWTIGGREDWRFADMREKYGKQWWWISFFAAFVSQQPMLVGVTLPLWAIHFAPGAVEPFGNIDTIANLLCITGIIVAYQADTELYDFMESNELRVRFKKPKELILDDGLWSMSRHPNYLGEQMWWWSLGAFGYVCGQPWTLVGTAFNSVIMAQVTLMTEARMRKNKKRQKEWDRYCAKTPVLIPYPSFPKFD